MAYVGTPLDTTNAFQSLAGKRFSGDGSTTDFTLDSSPNSTLDIEVFVGNVRQDPNSAYTVSGTTLGFTGAPPSGTNNIYVVHQAKAVGTIGIPDDTVSSQTDIGANIVDADLFLIDDGAGGTLRKTTASRLSTYIGAASTMNALTDVSMDITNFTNGLLIQTNSDGSAPTTGTLSSALANIGIGTDVFQALTSGDYNVAIGNESMDAHTEGSHNVAIGHATLSASTTADDNIAIGRSAGAAITTGGINILIGKNAGDGFDAEQKNIGIGNAALGGPIAGGEYNVAIGHEAGQVITSGDENNLLGYQSGEKITTGANNTCLGRNSGDTITTGSNNICIGSGSDVAANDQSNGIALGSVAAAVDDFSFGRSSNVVTNDFDSDANWSRSSDRRKKRNIHDQNLGLDFINDLRTVRFQWKPSNEFPKEWNDYSEKNNMNTDVIMHGFIAQEVKEALDKHATDNDKNFSGWKEGEDGMQHTSREMFVIPLIKAVQELSAEVKELKTKLENK